VRFALGILIGAATWTATTLGPVRGLATLLLPCAGFFVGGAIAGTALKRSVSAAFGFGLAFVIGNFVGMGSIIATQAMTGREQLLVPYALAYAAAFAVAGWIGLAGADVRGRPRVAGIAGFSGGGCATAILIVGLLKAQLIGGSLLSVLVAYALPMTVPWVIGGVVVFLNVPALQRSNQGTRSEQ
jgi:hypothetical protein